MSVDDRPVVSEIPCYRCGIVHEGSGFGCRRPLEVIGEAPRWAKPLAEPAPWGKHLRG